MAKQFETRFFGMILWVPILALVLTACPAAMPAAAPATDASVAERAAEKATEADSTEAESTDASAPPGGTTFNIVQEGTQARFSIYELLMGRDKTVIGTTTAVEGSITVDPTNPGGVIISPIRIDASTLATDSGRRDGAIKRWILETNQADYQYIVFAPIDIEGLPEAVTVGDTFEFTVIGELTIRDVTKQETFALSVTANSETELVGLGQTTIMRSDYNLSIPSVPSVANVAEEVPLEIEFTAVAG